MSDTPPWTPPDFSGQTAREGSLAFRDRSSSQDDRRAGQWRVKDHGRKPRWDAQEVRPSTTFRDFKGKVKDLGPVVYQWLVMRLGVDTVKPDVHVVRFVSRAVERPVNEKETVAALVDVAREIGIKANLLDWSIWEYERT